MTRVNLINAINDQDSPDVKSLLGRLEYFVATIQSLQFCSKFPAAVYWLPIIIRYSADIRADHDKYFPDFHIIKLISQINWYFGILNVVYMLSTLIIDDNIRDKEILELLLSRYCSDEIDVIGSASNISDACLLIAEKKPELIFLDIELGNESGFDLLAKFTHYPFRIIFATAHDKYAVKAIKFNALDYLLKPIEIVELVNAVQKVRARENGSIDTELKNLMHNLAHPNHKSNRVAIPVSNGYKMLAVETILYCEAKKEYTYIHRLNQAVICSSVNLGEYEDLLQDYTFCRVHHSFLVNKDHVKQYIKGEGGELIMENEIAIPVSRRKKLEVMDWLKK